MIEFHKIWIEQCAAAEGIKEQFGAKDAATLNITGVFAFQALDLRELIPFNNTLADFQDEYMPSYPPMSPITKSFFQAYTNHIDNAIFLEGFPDITESRPHADSGRDL